MLALKVGTFEYDLIAPTRDQVLLFERDLCASMGQTVTEYFDSASRFMEQFAVPSEIAPEKPSLQKVVWPVFGIARFAYTFLLVDSYTLQRIRTHAGTDNSVTLRFRDDAAGDPTEEPRELPLYLIDARPLAQNDAARPADASPVPAVNDAWVIALADKRYYFANTTGVGQSVTWTPSSWTELMQALATRLGVSVSVTDAIPSAYGTPTGRWKGGRLMGLPTAHLLDAAAHYTGGRIVCGTDGTYSYQRPTAANRAVASDAHATAVADDRHNGGGTLLFSDQIPNIPATAVGYFYDPEKTGCPAPTNGTAPTGGTKAGATVTACVDCSTTSTNANSALSQWAQDYYNWQNVPVDATYAGFVAVPKSGFIATVTYEHDGDKTARTCFIRPPLLYSSLLARGWVCDVEIPSSGSGSGSDSSGSGSSGGSTGFDVDYEDGEEIYDIQCLDGVQVVTRGLVAHVQIDSRIRHYWYGLYDTIEGCCACPGPQSGSSGSAGSGPACTTTLCPQCPSGMPSAWVTTDFFGSGAVSLNYAPTSSFPCRFAGTVGEYFVSMFFWPDTSQWSVLVERGSEAVGLWAMAEGAFACVGPNTFTRVAGFLGETYVTITNNCNPSAGGSVSTTCCAHRLLPTTLNVAFGVGGTGEYANLSGISTTIDWTLMQTWTSPASFADSLGVLWQVTYACSGTTAADWALSITKVPTAGVDGGSASPSTCDPLFGVVNLLGSGTISGTIAVTISE